MENAGDYCTGHLVKPTKLVVGSVHAVMQESEWSGTSEVGGRLAGRTDGIGWFYKIVNREHAISSLNYEETLVWNQLTSGTERSYSSSSES